MERKVWSEFQSKRKDGSVLKFSLQDCTEDHMDAVIDIYFKYLMREESFQRLSGVPNSEDAQKEWLWFVKGMLKQEGMHISVCIEHVTDAVENVVGVSSVKLMTVTEKKLPDVQPQTNEMLKLFEILGGLQEFYSIPKSYSVEKWHDGRGIIVHPDYRGFGIGTEFIKSRPKICAEHGLTVTSAWMTSIGTQKGAQRAGWETAFEIDSQEFSKIFDVTPYTGIAPTFKLMVGKV